MCSCNKVLVFKKKCKAVSVCRIFQLWLCFLFCLHCSAVKTFYLNGLKRSENNASINTIFTTSLIINSNIKWHSRVDVTLCESWYGPLIGKLNCLILVHYSTEWRSIINKHYRSGIPFFELNFSLKVEFYLSGTFWKNAVALFRVFIRLNIKEIGSK